MSRLTPTKAIRLKCLDCSNDQVSEVRLCPCTDCPLYDFRMGRNPNISKRSYTEDQRAHMIEALAKSRAKQQEMRLSVIESRGT